MNSRYKRALTRVTGLDHTLYPAWFPDGRIDRPWLCMFSSLVSRKRFAVGIGAEHAQVVRLRRLMHSGEVLWTGARTEIRVRKKGLICSFELGPHVVWFPFWIGFAVMRVLRSDE